MKCADCGYDDHGTGDTAHACPKFNRPVTAMPSVVLGPDKDTRIMELEQRIAELETDAARYRYLRKHLGMVSLDDDVLDAIEDRADDVELDIAIDCTLRQTINSV